MKASSGKSAKKAKASEQGFKLSKNMKKKLPAKDRETADRRLWEKSEGLCALCNMPLGSDLEHVAADHRKAESKGGKTTIANLYLAHKSCNSSRKNLEFEVAQPLVEFKIYSEETGAVSFDNVLDKYVHAPAKKVRFDIKGEVAALKFGASKKYSCPIFKDPATNVRYFYCDVPLDYVAHDAEVQPRLISYAHVRRLALDFLERPVHEPCNCRLVHEEGDVGTLKLFDGQHKTTAQILLKRDSVQVKVYIDPDIALLQSLVIKIQQDIKKQPLTRSDTLAKLGDVMNGILADYKVAAGQARTEKGLIDVQPHDKRTEVKKIYFEEIKRIIFWDDDNDLRDWVKPGAKNPPTTDKIVIDKIISKMIFPKVGDIDLDNPGGRDTERRLIHVVLNTLARKMLPKNWRDEGNELQRRRTETFFLGGAITWWVGDILVPTLRYFLKRIGDHNTKPLFLDNVSAEEESQIIEAVEALCDWEIWSTRDENILKAFRSNTLKNVTELLDAEHNQYRLIQDVS